MGLAIIGVIALVAGTLAGPIQEVKVSDTCARQCTVSNQFNYATGKTYEFSYETELRTAVQGASEDHAGVHLKSKAYLDVISKCEMILRFDEVQLMEHDPETSSLKPVKSGFVADLERNPLTISFQDGKVEELCLSTPESEQILNIKRGFLSMIQNTMDDINTDQTVTESDVSGECETEYTSEDKGWYNKLIKKSKNLLGCKQRQSSNIAVDSIPYNTESDVQSIPLITSTHVCEQEITKATGLINSANCQESHTFAPFSRLESGAVTLNTQTLTFVKEFKSTSKSAKILQRAPLQFQHESDSSEKTPTKVLEQKLMDICDNTQNGVTAETPKLFASLVKVIKTMGSRDLSMIYLKIQKNEICSSNNNRVRKYFLDAIPMCGTVDTLRYMVQLLTSGEITDMEADMWMTTLAFIQNPSTDMLAEVKPLLSMKTNLEKSMLSVSSLIHRVCKNNPRCSNFMEVKKMISMMENKIAPSCKVTDNTMKMSVLAIRAIGNAGFGEGAISTLTKCIQRSDNPIEIRLSAIQAFRRMSCSTDKSKVFAIFADTKEDSEVRIAAYKTLMECPSDDLIRKVKSILAGEVVNQVGSYVWSHLTNLMETSDPHKQSIRTILEDETLKKEFDLDQRKFSRNYEKSILIEKLNTGVTAEADLIWSSQSFIPRSGMLNLTVDLFGNAVNLFEVGGRVEGLEHFLESYFGPNGYFSENDVSDAAEVTALDIVKSDKINKIDKRNTKPMDDLRGSLYMKVFGNELRYVDFQGLDSLFAKNSLNFLDILMKLSKENDYQYTHSSMFMDNTLVVPTSSGFPLKLTVNGTSTIDLKASGMVDVMKLASSPPTMDVHGIIKPSGAIVVSSSMGIDAVDTQAGIKMVSTLHTSTSVQGKISIGKGSVLSVEFDLPEEKQDVISVSSTFYTVHRHTEREQKMITENRQEHIACTGSKVAEITGLEMCGEIAFPNASLVKNAPYFPMTGPVKASLTLYKRDKTMKGYKLEANSIHNDNVNIVRLAFSTPNSVMDRSFGADFSLNKAEGSIDASFTSPSKKADFTGSFTSNRAVKTVSGKLNFNGEIQFDVSGGLKSKSSGPGTLYTPTIRVIVPGMIDAGLSGSVNYAPWKYFETDLQINGLQSTPMAFKSSIQNKAKIQSISASIDISPKQTYSFDSSIQTTIFKKKINYESQLSVRSPANELLAFGVSFTNVYGKTIELDVVLDKIVKTPISVKTKLITKDFTRGRVQKIVRADIRSSLVELKMMNKFDNRNWKTLAADIDVTYVIRRIARDNIKFVTKLINLSSKTLTKGKASLNVASKRYPQYNIKILSNINHNRRLSEIEADIAYGENFKNVDKQISMSVSASKNIKSWSEASAAFNGKLLIGTNFRVISKIDHTHNLRSLDSNMMLRLNTDAMTASLSLKNNTDDKKNIYGEFKLDYPGKSIVLSHLLAENEPNEYTSTMNAKLGRSKNTVVTSVKKASASELSLSSSVNIDQMSPITVETYYNFGPDMYIIGGSVQTEHNKYSAETSANIKMGSSMELTTTVSYPSRNIICNIDSSKSGNKYSSRADIRWNAGRDDTQRVSLNGNIQIAGIKNIDSSVTLQYPGRTITTTLKNNVGNKVSTYASFKWEPNKVITIDTTYGIFDKVDSRQIIGSLKLRSPFKTVDTLDIDVQHQISDATYKTDVDMAWSPKDTVSGTLTIRRPLTINDIAIDVLAKAPTLGYKTLTASLQHHMNNGLRTVGKVTMNRQSMRMDISLHNNGNDKKTDITAQIDVKTTFRTLKSASVNIAYGNDGKKLDGSALLKYNKKTIGIQTSMRNILDGFNLISNGELSLNLPFDTIKTTWEHKHTTSEISTTSETTWDNKRVYVNLNGTQDVSLPKGKLSATLDIQTPLAVLKNVMMHLDHTHMSGQILSSLKISRNDIELANVEYKYLNNNNELTSSLIASNPWYDGTLSMMLTSSFASSPITAHLEMSLTPLQTISVDASIDMKDTSNIDATLSFTIPNKPAYIFTVSRNQQRSYVNSFVSIEYQPGKVIRLDSTHRTGAIKQFKLKFTSPFTTEYSAEGVFQQSKYSLRSNAMIVAEPYISKWAIFGSADISNGISGNLKLNTPYTEASYSELSILSENADGAVQSSITIEYLPGKVIKLSGLHEFNSFQDMKLTLKIATPFDEFSYGSMALRHQGNWQRFSNYGEVEYTKGKKITIETKHMMDNGILSSISVKTPYTQDIFASVSHHGNLHDFESHGEVTVGSTYSADLKHKQLPNSFESSVKFAVDETAADGSIQFSFDPKITTTISINTPIKSFENIRISQTFEGSWSKFSTGAKVSVSNFGPYSVFINMDMESDIAMDISLQTPFKAYRDLKATFQHQGPVSRFSTHLDVQNGFSKYNGDIKFSNEPTINFDAAIKTPYKTFALGRISLTFEGALNNFKLNTEMQKNKDVSELELVCNVQKKYDLDLTIKSPYTNTIKASFDHWGSWKKFQSKFNYKAGKDKIISNIRFALRPTLNAMFSIKSPFAWLKNHQLSLKHAGSSDSFKSNVEYKSGGKTYVGDASFQNLNSMKAELNIKGSTIRPINVAVTHDGNPRNFKSSATMSMGKKSLQVDAALNTMNGIKGSVDIKTPFNGVKNINAAISHTGDLSNFKSHGELKYNRQSGQVDLALYSTKDISASATVSTPFKGFEDISASLVHSGTAKNFNTIASYKQNGKSLESEIGFKSSPSLAGSASLKSNIESIGTIYGASFNIDGDFNKFGSIGEININNKKSSANFDMDTRDGFEVKLGAKSPIIDDTDLYFKYSSADSAINTNAYIVQNDVKQYSMQSILSKKPDIGAIVSITTPHVGYESTEFSFHQEGTLNDFRSDVELQLFGEKYQCDVTFTSAQDTQASLSIKSPHSADIDVSVSFQGSIFNYNTGLTYSYGKERQLRTEMSLNLEGPYSGDLKIITPMFKNIKASFKHKGGIQNFASEAHFTYAGMASYSVLTFKTMPDFESTFSLSTPMTKDLALRFYFAGPMRNFQTSGFVKYNGQSQIEFDGDFLLKSTMEANLKVNTVLSIMKQFSTKFSHSGDLSAFQCNGEVNFNDMSINVDITYSPASGSIRISSPFMKTIEGTYSFAGNNGNVQLSAPFMENLSASYNVQGKNILKSDSEVKVQYGSTKVVQASGSFNYPRSGELEVQTPVAGYESTRVTYNRVGSFGCNGTLELNDVRHNAGITLDTKQRLTASAFLDSPMLPSMSSKINLDGSIEDFTGHFEIVYESNRQELDVQLSTLTDIKGSFALNSPHIPEFKVTFDSNKDLNNLKASGDILYDSRSILSLKTVLETTTVRKSVSFSAIVPGNTIKVAASIDGSIRSFTTRGFVTYNGQPQIEFDGDFQLKSTMEANLKVNTVLSIMKQFSTKFSHSGDLSAFQCNGEVNLNDISIYVDITYSPASGSIRISSPFMKTIEGTYSFAGNNGNVQLSAPFMEDLSASYNVQGKNILKSDSEVKVQYGSTKVVQASGSFNYPRSGELEVQTPVAGYESTRVTYNRVGRFGCNGALELNDVRHNAGISLDTKQRLTASAFLDSPMLPSMSSKINLDGSIEDFTGHFEIVYESNRQELDVQLSTLTDIKGSFALNSPHIPEFKVTFDSNKDLNNLKASGDILFDSRSILSLKTVLENTTVRKSVSFSAIVPGNTVKVAASIDGVATDFIVNAIASCNDKEISSNLAFRQQPLTGSLSFKSPFTPEIKTRYSFNNNGYTYKGQCEFSVDSKKSTLDLSASLKPLSVEISAYVFSKQLTASLFHDGPLSNFKSSSGINIDGQEWTTSMQFNIEDTIKGSFELASPVTKPIEVSFENVRTQGNLKHLMSLKYGESIPFRSELLLSTSPLKASANIKTPFNGFTTVSASMSHTGKALNFNNNLELAVEDKKAGFDMSFNFDSLNGQISAFSPFFPAMSTGFEFTGNAEKFSASSNANYGNDKYSMEVKVTTKGRLQASVTINSPIQGFQKMTTQIKHKGQFPNIDSFAQMLVNRRNIFTGSAKMNTRSGVIAEIAAQSVFAPDVQINLKHKGEISNFNSNGEIRINGHPSTAIIAFATDPSMSGSLEVNSPYIYPVSGAFGLKYLDDKMNSHVEGTIGSKTITFDGNVEYGNVVGISLDLVTPFEGIKNLQGSAQYEKQYKGFKTNVNLRYPGGKIESESKTSWRQEITSTLSLKTPFNSFRNSKVDFSLDNSLPSLASEINLVHSGKKYSLRGDLKDMQGRISATTPFEGFEDVNAEFRYQGPISDMQASAKFVYMTGKEISASFQNLFREKKVESKIQLETPYTNDFNFDLSLTGELSDFSNVLTISMGDDTTMTSATGLKMGQNEFDLDSSLQTVIAGIADEQKITISVSGVIPNAEASINAKLFGSKYYVNTNLIVDDNTSGKLVLRTPFSCLQDVDFSFEHSGSMRRFTTKSSLQYDTDKKIEGSLQYMKYGWRRLHTILEIQTPFNGFETSKVEYRHTASVDSFECSSDLRFMENDISGTFRVSLSPLMASISVSTPFADFEKLGSDIKVDYGSRFINFDSNVQFMRDNTISLTSSVNAESNPQIFDLKFTTPFQGYESFEIRATNTGSMTDFQSDLSLSSTFIPSMRTQANMKYVSLMNVDGSFTFNSQISSLESVSMSLKTEAKRGKYQIKFETTWAPTKTITVSGVFTDNKYSMDANVELSTPFQAMRQLNMRSETINRGQVYSEKLTLSHNGKSIADSELSINMGNKKSAQITIRKPVEIMVNIEGSTDNKYEVAMTVLKDTTDPRNAFKINGVFDPTTRQLSLQHSCPQMSGSFDGKFKLWNNNFDLYLNGVHYGYKMELDNNDGKLKVILPSRSLLVKGTKSASTTEGSFMWDADNDESRKVGFRTVVRQSKADISIMMPSIGKEVQVDSQVSMNTGRVIFDGKTEVVYSRDISKKITMMARLEDITDSWSSKNYSFTFGISHPYTSVGFQLASEIGKSDDKISGGLNMYYLTAGRDTKTFSVNGAIDGSSNTFFFNMDTPMKKININGNAQNTSPYQLTLTNKYDNKRPLTTMATFDPAKRSASFQMNYDLDNPKDEFHLSAKFVNSSTVAAEMFHVINRQRITDALLALRLNTSTLLHSRIHWRPEMINDLKAFYSSKARGYSRGIKNELNAILAALDNELSQKSRLITRSLSQEMKPVTDTFVAMYKSNEFHVRDITDMTIAAFDKIMMNLAEISEVSEDCMREMAIRLETRLSNCMANYRNQMEAAVLTLQKGSSIAGGMYRNYTDYVYTKSLPITNMVSDNYIKYMNQMDTSNMANLYISTIYNAREAMNTGLDVVKSNRIYQQGENAFKYWEIRENVEMVAEEMVDWIKQEVEKEMADIKATVMNAIQSEITVMDIENGEIQPEVHLPIPIKTLDVLPKIDYMPYLTKAKKYIPEIPLMSVPLTLLPPFEGVATIQGNTITTFDGITYNFDGSCTYLLARDNTDYNFTVALHMNGINKTLAIVADGKTFNIYSNGMVSINGQFMELPVVLKDTIVTSLDGRVSVSVAGHINVEYDSNEDLYVVKLNGFYFGKTNGLFGTYDNEPSNDLLTSYKKPTKSIDRFTKTWDIGTEHCR